MFIDGECPLEWKWPLPPPSVWVKVSLFFRVKFIISDFEKFSEPKEWWVEMLLNLLILDIAYRKVAEICLYIWFLLSLLFIRSNLRHAMNGILNIFQKCCSNYCRVERIMKTEHLNRFVSKKEWNILSPTGVTDGKGREKGIFIPPPLELRKMFKITRENFTSSRWTPPPPFALLWTWFYF